MAKKRANGEGSIRRKPNGRWEGRYTVGIDPATGRAVQKSVSAKTRAECGEKLQRAIRENRGIPANHSGDYTVAEWCRLWFETQQTEYPPEHGEIVQQHHRAAYHPRHRRG